MDIPFRTIERVDMTSSGAGIPLGYALATITLSQSPNFYMEAPTGVGDGRIWKPCTDWTEAFQASTMLRHELIGSAVQLYEALNRFPGNRSPAPSPPPGAVVLNPIPTYTQQPPPYMGGGSGGGGSGSGLYSDPSSSRSPHHRHSPGIDFMESPPGIVSSPHFAFAPPIHETAVEALVAQATVHGRQRSNSGPAAYHSGHGDAMMSSSALYSAPGPPFSSYSMHHQADSPASDYLSIATGSSIPPTTTHYREPPQHLEHQYASFSALHDMSVPPSLPPPPPLPPQEMTTPQSLPPPILPLSNTRTPPPTATGSPTYLHHPQPHRHQQSNSITDYTSVPIARASMTRSYSQSAGMGTYDAMQQQQSQSQQQQIMTPELLPGYTSYLGESAGGNGGSMGHHMMPHQPTPPLTLSTDFSSLGGALDYGHPRPQSSRHHQHHGSSSPGHYPPPSS